MALSFLQTVDSASSMLCGRVSLGFHYIPYKTVHHLAVEALAVLCDNERSVWCKVMMEYFTPQLTLVLVLGLVWDQLVVFAAGESVRSSVVSAHWLV